MSDKQYKIRDEQFNTRVRYLTYFWIFVSGWAIGFVSHYLIICGNIGTLR